MKKPTENKMVVPHETKMPRLLDRTRFGKYMGWHRAHVNEYYKRTKEGTMNDGFPMPVQIVGRTALWSIDQVRAYAMNNENKVKAKGEYWKDKAQDFTQTEAK